MLALPCNFRRVLENTGPNPILHPLLFFHVRAHPPPLSPAAARFTFFPSPASSSPPRIFNRGTHHQRSDQAQRVPAKYRVKFPFFFFVDFRRGLFYLPRDIQHICSFIFASVIDLQLNCNVFNEYVQFTRELQENVFMNYHVATRAT